MPHGAQDTRPDAERVQIELLRAAGPARRAALRRAHLEASEQEIGLLYAEQHCGRDLAQRVRRYIEEHASPSPPRGPE